VTNSLRVGLLPLWAFIAIIVVIAVLLVALIRALVKRRSIYYDGW
jgi:membrane protein YdbS with pleckstrin-like domain